MYVILYFNYTQLYINNVDNSIHYVNIVHNCTRDFFFSPNYIHILPRIAPPDEFSV